MFISASSPVVDIDFGKAMQISLDNYYDILKATITGGNPLSQEQYIQLSLASLVVDLSNEEVKASVGGYHWYSKYQFLLMSDRSIAPAPIDGAIVAAIAPFHREYQNFINRLLEYAILKDLSASEQLEVSKLTLQIEKNRQDLKKLRLIDQAEWSLVAQQQGVDVGDVQAWYLWSTQDGYYQDMNVLRKDTDKLRAKRAQLLNRQYGSADDKAIADAVVTMQNVEMGYPLHPDSLYSNGDDFTPTYLATQVLGDNALFDRRPVVTWALTNKSINTTVGGGFTATFDKGTKESKSISTDWSASVSGSYGFIKARASASESKKISEDFEKGTTIALSSTATLRVGINFQPWLDETLFRNLRLKENLSDFTDLFGPQGSLRYYPKEAVLLRGMSVEFSSTQSWQYDYESKFSASGGGGFGAFGVSFGGSASYSKNVKEHKVDKSSTKLTFKDDTKTTRLIGYVVQRNTLFDEETKSGKVFSGR